MKVYGLRKGDLKRVWTYKTAGIIWRVLPSDSGKLLGEVRYKDNKKVEFFCIDQASGDIHWERRGFGEKWWVGIEAIHKDVLYLHGFATPEMPEHKQIIAVDLLSGEQLWFNADLKFEIAVDDSLYATRNTAEGNMVFELQYRSGAILRSWGSDHQVLREARIRSVSPASTAEFPVPVESLQEVDNRLAEIVTGGERKGSFEVVPGNLMVVFNYHKKSDVGAPGALRFDNVLRVFDRQTGKIVYQENLNIGAAAVIPYAFFVQGDMLFYIKERRSLTAVRLQVRG